MTTMTRKRRGGMPRWAPRRVEPEVEAPTERGDERPDGDRSAPPVPTPVAEAGSPARIMLWLVIPLLGVILWELLIAPLIP